MRSSVTVGAKSCTALLPALVSWLLLGATSEVLASERRASTAASSPAEASRDIRTASITPPSAEAPDKVRVVVRSFETAAIGAEINARITYLPTREGDRFRKGDVLIEFDCSKIVAERDAAVASFKSHRAAYENQRQMLRYKAAGSLAVDQARFEMEKTEADVRGLEAKRAGCKVLAPFDGRVSEKAAHIHEIAQPNQPLVKIVNESKLELVMMVPSASLARLGNDTRFDVVIDETGERHEARVVQSTGLIDPVSQSVRLIAEIARPTPTVLPGMSGTAFLSNGEARR